MPTVWRPYKKLESAATGHHDRVSIEVNIEGIDIVGLVDTGSARTLIRKDVWINVCKKVGRCPLMKPCKERLKTVSGQWLHIEGTTLVVLYEKVIEVYIYKDLVHDILLGDDALAILQANIDYPTKTVTLMGKKHPYQKAKNDIEIAGLVLDDYKSFVPSVFAPDIGDGKKIGVEMHIDTGTARPMKQRAYRLPLTKRVVVENEIDEMLRKGIIQPSHSPWASPITLAPKKDNTFRFCIDYRKLNSVTVDDSHPLPHIQDIFDSLHGSTVFTTVDLRSGYWQIPMSPEDIPKTAFVTHRGLYEFTRLPFGLKNAPAVFQRAMQSILGSALGDYALVYIDDVIIFSKNEEDHERHVKCVLKKFEEYGLVVKESKCKFHQKELPLLGYIVSGNGIRADPGKTEAINAMPSPHDVKGIQRFLGMVNYYRQLIPNCSKITEPLAKLIRKGEPFIWGPEQEQAFCELKLQLTSDHVMKHPDVNRPYRLYTDASGCAIGGILVQLDDQGVERPIQYISKTLHGRERVWSTIEREAYAIVYALTKLRPYLFGAQFVIYTDHKPLKALFVGEVRNTKTQRWASLISEYGAPIEYKSGRNNVRADMLSRIPQVAEITTDTANWVDAEARPGEVLPWYYDGLNRKEVSDKQKEMMEWDMAGEDGSHYEISGSLLWSTKDIPGQQPYPRLVLPVQYRQKVIERCHKEVGHQGVEKTLYRVRDLYVWPKQRVTVKGFCKKCSICQVNADRKEYPPPTGMPVASYPNEIVGIDTVGPLTTSEEGCKYLVTLIDHATGWAEAYPVRDRNAASVIRILERDFIPRHGPPAIIIHDNGKEFVNNSVRQFCEDWRIELRRTCIYRPQTNGKVERFHRTLKNILRKLVNNRNNQWERHLGTALLGYRQSVSDTTGFSPSYLHYGRRLGFPRPNGGPDCTDPRILGTRLEDVSMALAEAMKNTATAKQVYMDRAIQKTNASPLRVGDRVLPLAHERTPLD